MVHIDYDVLTKISILLVYSDAKRLIVKGKVKSCHCKEERLTTTFYASE